MTSRKLGVSADQLRQSAQQANPAEVQALIDAGVDVNSGSDLSDSAIHAAVFSGCGASQGETDGLVNTVTTLVAAGANLQRKDDNGNDILVSAAQMCGPRIVGVLVTAGADISGTSTTGLSALAMALLMHHPDSADVLVNKGARLSPSQVQMISASAADPRSKAIIQRATGK